MYDIAGNQEKALALMCLLLSQVAAEKEQSGSQRERYTHQAEELHLRYSSNGYKCSNAAVMNFNLLRGLITFFDNFHYKQYVQAMEILRDLRIVPFSASEVDDRTNNFKNLIPEVKHLVPDVLLAAMTVLVEQYQSYKNKTVNKKFEEATLKVRMLLRTNYP